MLHMLSLAERAKVMLYKHCTGSKGTIQRRLDLICRSKKLSKKKYMLSPFGVSVISALGRDGKVIQSNYASNMSPILELQLVDCVHCLEDTSSIGWSIIKTL